MARFKPLNAGDYRHRIDIRQPPTTEDSAGQISDDDADWTSLATNVPAAIETAAGREFFAAGAEQQQGRIRFRIRRIAGVTATMRVRFDGRLFDIAAPPIDVDERRREVHLICLERA